MLQKIIFSICLLCLSILPVNAHDFDVDVLRYILSTPDATWTDFTQYVSQSGSSSIQDALSIPEGEVLIALELPGKLYVGNYVNDNPDFSYEEFENLIADDPMLTELGTQRVYDFVKDAIAQREFKKNISDTTIENNFKQDREPATESLSSFESFYRSIAVGLGHILLGYDHIIFLLTLIICLPRLRRILGIITTFTLAHSITILLGGLQIVSIPSIIVESMILISIIIMALYALKGKVGEVKNFYFETSIIFILGLFHGLGFAGFFSEVLETSENIIIPVLGFNIGVELGQIIIMSVLLSILYCVYKYFSKYKNTIKNILSIFSIIAASYWLIISFI